MTSIIGLFVGIFTLKKLIQPPKVKIIIKSFIHGPYQDKYGFKALQVDYKIVILNKGRPVYGELILQVENENNNYVLGERTLREKHEPVEGIVKLFKKQTEKLALKYPIKCVLFFKSEKERRCGTLIIFLTEIGGVRQSPLPPFSGNSFLDKLMNKIIDKIDDIWFRFYFY